MHDECWMRPALQKSEAVLLPALEHRRYAPPRFADRFAYAKPAADPFRPVTQDWSDAQQTTALSTYVRPRGSMAGRSVLRAAGMGAGCTLRRPRYAARRGRLPHRGRFR